MVVSITRKFAAFMMAAAATFMIVGTVGAADNVRTSNVSDHQLALKGYDAVAYFDVGVPTGGKSRFTTTYKDVEYRFSTATNRDKFIKDPKKYQPQYGGFCSFGTSVGLKLEVDPEAFDIVDGKLYLNNSHEIRTMWLEDPQSRIKAANANWKKIKNVPAGELEAMPFEG